MGSTPQTHTTVQTAAGATCGLASAVLFGVSAPAAKLLLPRIDPWTLAGLLYAGAGAGLFLMRLGRHHRVRPTQLRRGDLPMLIAIAVIGGGIGPVLMLLGLRHVSGVAGALLLNLEAVFTAVLAVTFFGEHVSRMESSAIAIVIAGAVVISGAGAPFRAEAIGAFAIAGACLAWGLDNNLTARLSARNPVELVEFKTVTAGAGNLMLAYIAGHRFPAPELLLLSLALGFFSYGLSIVLDVYALRYVGAAREAAFFATAPFAGAVAAVPLLHEAVRSSDFWAGGLMALGVMLLMLARRRGSSL